MTVRKLGGATIEKVEEICGAGFKPARMFPNFDQEAFDAQKGWMLPDHVEPGSDRLVGSVHTWIVKTPRHTILIDTCLGNHKQRTGLAQSRHAVPQPAEAAAVRRVGRLRDVHASPCRSRGETRRHYKKKKGERLVRQFGAARRRGRQGRMIESDHQPDPLLTIKDYPGHTPGSIAINLRDDARQACFSGDIMHHPIQVYHPDWSSQFCWDQAMSARSRRQLLEDCVESNALLCPAHFPGANAGYIKAAGDSFRSNGMPRNDKRRHPERRKEGGDEARAPPGRPLLRRRTALA